MKEFYWLNPNFTPYPGADLTPLVKGRMPAEIHEDCNWLVTSSNAGYVITDLWLGQSIFTGRVTLEDLQTWVSGIPDPFSN